MKKFVCEMCGSSEIIKQDGMFVCQDCGLKYTPEEARKLLQEVDGSVPAAAPAAGGSSMVENTLKLAREAMNADNNAQCEKYANKVLEMDAENYEAWYLKGVATAWQTSLKNLRITEAVSNWENALKYVPEGDNETFTKVAKDISSTLDKVTIAVYSLYIDNMFGTWDNDYYQTLSKGLAQLQLYYRRVCINFSITCIGRGHESFGFGEHKSAYVPFSMFQKGLNKLEKNFNDCCQRNSGLNSLLDSTKGYYLSMLVFYYVNCYLDDDDQDRGYDACANLIGRAANRLGAAGFQKGPLLNVQKDCLKAKKEQADKRQAEKEKEKKERIEKYWKEHAEEKKALEDEKAALGEKIAAKEKEMKSVPEAAALARIDSDISALEQQKAGLGLFKGKEKKALQEQIDALAARKPAAQQALAAAQKPFADEIGTMNARLREIHTELTKDR